MLAGIVDPAGHAARRVRTALGDHACALATAGAIAVACDGELSTHKDRLWALDGTLYAAPNGTRDALQDAPSDELLERLRGNFSLVSYDGAAGRGIAARDHLGERGLVWAPTGGGVAFASDVDLLIRLLPTRPAPNDATLAHWLGCSGIPPGHTFFEGVRRVEPGCLLAFDGHGGRTRRYWTLRYERLQKTSREEAVELLRGRLVEAIERRAAGPRSAIQLSGGLDSSTVATLAVRAVREEVRPRRSYSALFPGHPSTDEADLIACLCEALPLQSTRAVVRSGSVVAGALPYLERFEVPPISPNLFFWLPMLRAARADGVEVMLDGEGGDEVFGISPMLLADRLRAGRLLSTWGLIKSIPGADGARPPWASVWRMLLEFAVRGATPPAAHRAVRRIRGEMRYAPASLTPRAAAAYVEVLDGISWKAAGGPRWWAYLLDITTRGMGPGMMYDHVRRRAALARLETRHPLVDVDVIEQVLRLPPELTFDPHLTRPLLREVTAGLMPDQVRLRRRKSHFNAVFHESLAGVDRPLLEPLLGSGTPELAAYLDMQAFRREVLDRKRPANHADANWWALSLWRAVTAELWLRQQADPSAPRSLIEAARLPGPDLTVVTPRESRES